jgi:hypothetical protein
MWGEDKVWNRYRTDVLAADADAAALMMAFLYTVAAHRLYGNSLEVIDLQRYKTIRRPSKVRQALKERMHLPFVFPVGRN